ncbi:DUF3570 domain-containing protein [Paraglaciecola arctica]|uniref:DUF3570 domain-containing protein n=1 Tax=Paraglaciecola arctica TaxID=1128911 RepID=UPI001C06FAFC|nr:DUF3570 domain-containing protein [Paraglaciecola arctica]MBU3006241.1 DUF3570 domain-containing protein [Paraglaciecola arctica]
MQLTSQSNLTKQTKKITNVNSALAAATCALLGSASVVQAEESVWEMDTALLYYGETDRVTAVEGVFSAKKDFGDEHVFSGKLVLDTLTGASATGAVSQPNAQTFTRPSGKGQYEINGGDVPLDDTFKDTRLQLEAQWTQPLWDDMRGSAGVHFSKEYDYLSVAVNGSLARDFNQKNTTISAGVSLAFDTIDPEGGRPVAFSEMVVNQGQFANDQAYQVAFDATRQKDSDDKNTIDLMFGVTQVINRRMLMQFNYGYSTSDGYHTDPFKVLSIVNDQGVTQSLVHEDRPTERTRHSFYWQTKYALDSGVADISYRYATDDWDINSHTIDSRLRFNISDNTYIQPHFRYYQQGAAEFYQPFLMEGSMLPTFASADYRLGEMTAYTVGLKYGMKMPSGNEWAFRLEYYQQDPKNAGFDEPGVLQQLDLYPSVKAVIAQISYSF